MHIYMTICTNKKTKTIWSKFLYNSNSKVLILVPHNCTIITKSEFYSNYLGSNKKLEIIIASHKYSQKAMVETVFLLLYETVLWKVMSQLVKCLLVCILVYLSVFLLACVYCSIYKFNSFRIPCWQQIFFIIYNIECHRFFQTKD